MGKRKKSISHNSELILTSFQPDFYALQVWQDGFGADTDTFACIPFIKDETPRQLKDRAALVRYQVTGENAFMYIQPCQWGKGIECNF